MRLDVSTERRTEVVDVTDRVNEAVPDGYDGTCTVFVRHTTAALVVNEAESRLLDDVETFVSDFAPDGGWRHDESDDNTVTSLRS